MSSVFNVFSGVPAGSHLGPFLFVHFVSDIERAIKFSKFLMYVDTKIFLAIESIDDYLKLWHDVESVTKWCNENRLHLKENCVCLNLNVFYIRINDSNTVLMND